MCRVFRAKFVVNTDTTFINVTGLLLVNNEIVQSILSTYTALQTCLQVLNSRTVVWLFAILCESFNVWLYYVTFVCCFCLMAISRRWPLLSSSAVLVFRHRLSRPSSAMPNDFGHRSVDHLASPYAHLTHRRRCPELMHLKP